MNSHKNPHCHPTINKNVIEYIVRSDAEILCIHKDIHKGKMKGDISSFVN